MKKYKQAADVYFDYRNPKQLMRHIDAFGRISPMSRTGLSAKQQRQLAVAVKRARHLAYMPFVATN
jgi:small subunit ribosomal protein S18